MLKITLKRSTIGFASKQERIVKALGLGKIGSYVVQAETPAVLGMIRKIPHLVEVERLAEPVEGREK